MKFIRGIQLGFMHLALLVATLFVMGQSTPQNVEAEGSYTVTLPYIERCVNYNCYEDYDAAEPTPLVLHTGYKVRFYEDASRSSFMDEEVNSYLMFPSFTAPTGAIYGGQVIITDWQEPAFDEVDSPFEDTEPHAWPQSFDYPPNGPIELSLVEAVWITYCHDPYFSSGSVTPSTGTNPLSVTATASFGGDYTIRQYDFGDGTPFTTTRTHTYNTEGTYTVKARAQSECDSTYTEWEIIGTVTVIPLCSVGIFDEFTLSPKQSPTWINEDVVVAVDVYDDCGDPIPGNVDYTVRQDPNGANTLYSSGTQPTPFNIPLQHDGVYSITLTKGVNSDVFQYYNLDKSGPTGTLTASNPVVEIDDPADLTQTITFTRTDPAVNNAHSGFHKKLAILGGTGFKFLTNDPVIFNFTFTSGDLLYSPSPTWVNVPCTGNSADRTYRTGYDTANQSSVTLIGCTVTGDKFNETFTITFDIHENIMPDGNNEVYYSVINVVDVAANDQQDIIDGYFTIDYPVYLVPEFTIDITSPMDGSNFIVGNTFDLDALVTINNMHGNYPSFNWTTNAIKGKCPTPGNPTQVTNPNNTIQLQHADAICEYTLSGTVIDAFTTYNATDTTTITTNAVTSSTGYIDSGWDLYLDNYDPEFEYYAEKNGQNLDPETIWFNADDAVVLAGSVVETHKIDSGPKQALIESVEEDNNALYTIPISLEQNGNWTFEFTEPNVLHRSVVDFVDEEHPVVTLTALDRVHNKRTESFHLNYDTVKPYVMFTSPEDESLLLDLNSEIIIILREDIHTSNPISGGLPHGFDNVDVNSLENDNIFLYDITNGKVTNQLNFTVNTLTGSSSEDRVELSINIAPDNLLKLRTYQLRVNSFWNGTQFETIDSDKMISDAAGNPLDPFALTFSTLNKPDILRIDKSSRSIDTGVIDETITRTLDPFNTEPTDEEVIEFTLTVLPDISETVQTAISPPYTITDLLPPYFMMLQDAEYRIVARNGNKSNWVEIALSEKSIIDTDRMRRGHLLVWEFDNPTYEIPWGGRLEIRYRAIVTY